MKNETIVTAIIALLFVMLWLPMGQHDFLIDHWMKIGTYAIPFLGIGIFAFKEAGKSRPLRSDLRFLAVLLLIAYLLHQFEEHWIDLFGNYYAFYTFNNNVILENLSQPSGSNGPLTKESIFVINTSLVWLVGLLAIVRSPRHLFPLFAMAGIVVVNGLVHLLAGIATFRYNPGLLTSIVLFIPLYFWTIKQLHHRIVHYKIHIIAGLLWAFLAHVIMVAGLLAANWFRILPEYLFWIVLVLWSMLPLVILRKTT
ncbi:MAG: HXXEE domain-containing protein [Bacteroidota bacterium]